MNKKPGKALVKAKASDPKTGFQMSLDKWFVKTDTEGNIIESTYKIFYLEWTADSQSATWIPIMPPEDKITYRTTVKCTSISDDIIQVIGYIPDPIKLPTELTEGYYTNIAYLKSHLQKTIRRRQVNLALKTANHFFRLDPTEFLRRLGIIMLEDVHLMESFNILTWLMVASSKAYSLDKSQIYWLFGLVYNLCKAEYWDQLPREPPLSEGAELNCKAPDQSLREITKVINESWKKHLPKLNAMQKSLIYSLQFRKAYGGLAGDKKLISSLTDVWINRFLSTSKDNISNETTNMWLKLLESSNSPDTIKFLSPPEEALTLEQWILPAIDFHCAPNIISILSDKYEEFTVDEIKATIWHCNSKYNDRTHNQSESTDKKYKKIWEKIRPQFYSLANYFLIHNY